MVVCEMQTMLKTTFTQIAMKAGGGAESTGLTWGLGYATGTSSHCLTVIFQPQ